MSILRLIGDQHNEYKKYLSLIKDCDYSIQVGDLGLNYSGLRYICTNNYVFDTEKHKFLPGNHDCYEKSSIDYYKHQPNCLGDYGVYKIPSMKDEIFFVRGAWSIDGEYRKSHYNARGHICWWEEEELSAGELNSAIDLYKEVKPRIMVTHEAPLSIVENFTDPNFPTRFGYQPGVIKTKTGQALQAMFEIHQPQIWIFGHYHQRWEDKINRTDFILLDMYRKMDQTTDYYDLEF